MSSLGSHHLKDSVMKDIKPMKLTENLNGWEGQLDKTLTVARLRDMADKIESGKYIVKAAEETKSSDVTEYATRGFFLRYNAQEGE